VWLGENKETFSATISTIYMQIPGKEIFLFEQITVILPPKL